MENSTLVVLCVPSSRERSPFQVLNDYWGQLRGCFGTVIGRLNLGTAISDVRDSKQDYVLVIEGAFVREFSGGQEALEQFFREKQIPANKIVFGVQPAPDVPVAYSHMGEVDSDLVGLVMKAQRSS